MNNTSKMINGFILQQMRFRSNFIINCWIFYNHRMLPLIVKNPANGEETRTKTSIRYAKENDREKREREREGEREREKGRRRDIEREGEM